MTVIKNACTEDWAQMDGAEATRFCTRCATHVTDVDVLDDAEVLALLQRRPRCIRARVDRSGRVLRLVALAGAVALATAELSGAASEAPPPTGAAEGAATEARAPEAPAAVPGDATEGERLRVFGYLE